MLTASQDPPRMVDPLAFCYAPPIPNGCERALGYPRGSKGQSDFEYTAACTQGKSAISL